MQYTPTWNNPYAMMGNMYGQSQIMPTTMSMQQGIGSDYTVKVNGKESAYQFCQRLGPNSTSPVMFDTTNVGVMYIGTTDGAGVPSVETFDFKPHVDEPAQPAIDPAQYVSRTELDGIIDQIRQLKEEINGIHGQAQATGTTANDHGPVTAG